MLTNTESEHSLEEWRCLQKNVEMAESVNNKGQSGYG